MERTPAENFVLCGIKHCGKTTHGKRLAAKLGYAFIDTDDALSAAYEGKTGNALTPRQIYTRHGEDYFRKLEAEAVSTLAEPGRCGRVIALGGGVPANPYLDVALLRHLGVCVYLKIDPGIAYARVAAGGLPPFLQAEPDPYRKFLEIGAARDVFYTACADLIFDIDADESADAVFSKLCKVLSAKGML